MANSITGTNDPSVAPFISCLRITRSGRSPTLPPPLKQGCRSHRLPHRILRCVCLHIRGRESENQRIRFCACSARLNCNINLPHMCKINTHTHAIQNRTTSFTKHIYISFCQSPLSGFICFSVLFSCFISLGSYSDAHTVPTPPPGVGIFT